MLIGIRYVFGRLSDHRTGPKLLGVDKDTGLPNYSHAKRQDITAESYRHHCEESAIIPRPDTLQHLRERDLTSWTYTDQSYIDGRDIQVALNEAAEITKRMSAERSKDLSPRNVLHCQMCDWKTYCRNDPEGQIEDWFGVQPNTKYSGIVRELNVRGMAPSKTPDPSKAFITSPSGLTSYMQCPRKWRFSYDKGLEVVKPGWSRISARVKGTLVHFGVEKLLREIGIDGLLDSAIPPHVHGRRDSFYDKVIRQPMKDFFDNELDNGNIEENERAQALFHAIPTAIRIYKETVQDLVRIEYIEQRFIFRIPGTHRWITCQPDLVAKDKQGRRVVIDFKSTSTLNLPNKAREFESRITMPLYAYAVKYGYLLRENEDGTEAS